MPPTDIVISEEGIYDLTTAKLKLSGWAHRIPREEQAPDLYNNGYLEGRQLPLSDSR